MTIIFIFIFIFILFWWSQQKIHIDLKSFFRKGFKKFDNDFGLFCYCGKQGKGKTYSAIKFLIERKLEKDYKILTNVHSFKTFNDTLFFNNITDIIDYCTKFKDNAENVIIFFDEIFTILEKKTAINKEILSFISQLRKRHIIFITTAQEWSEINITFRRYVRFQVDCNMFSIPFFRLAFQFNSINDGDQIRWNNDLQEFVAPRISANFSKCNKSIVESYDTFETINVSK